MNDLFNHTVNTLPAPLLYLLIAGIVVASGVPIFSAVVPAEPILMVATLLTIHGPISLWQLCVVATAASAASDVLSYALGARCATSLLRTKFLTRQRSRLISTRAQIRRHGMASLVMQRWVPPTRGIVPVIMGTARSPFGRFVAVATGSAIIWANINILAVYFGGTHLLLAVPLLVAVIAVSQLARRLWARRRAG